MPPRAGTPRAAPPPTLEAPLTVGEVRGAFGIKGWVRIRSYCRPPDGIFDYQHWWLRDPATQTWTPFALLCWQAERDGFAVQLGGIGSRDAALGLQGAAIAVPRAAVKVPNPDSYLWQDLIGLSVETLAGEPLGSVAGLIETGAADVLEIRDETSGRSRLIPFVLQRFIVEVDVPGGRLRVDWHPDD